jgi:hypothetical protein
MSQDLTIENEISDGLFSTQWIRNETWISNVSSRRNRSHSYDALENIFMIVPDQHFSRLMLIGSMV